jgi:hypothetical protein
MESVEQIMFSDFSGKCFCGSTTRCVLLQIDPETAKRRDGDKSATPIVPSLFHDLLLSYDELPEAVRTYCLDARIGRAKQLNLWVSSYIEAHIWDPDKCHVPSRKQLLSSRIRR